MATLYSVDGVAAANVRGYGQASITAPANICFNPECYSYNGAIISGSGQNVASASYANLGHPGTAEDYVIFRSFYVDKSTFLTSSGNSVSSANISSTDDYFALVVYATLNISTAGNYRVRITGSDAVEAWVAGTLRIGYYGSHGAGVYVNSGLFYLSSGNHSLLAYQEKNGTSTGSIIVQLRGPDTGESYVIITTTHCPTGIFYDKYTFIRP